MAIGWLRDQMKYLSWILWVIAVIFVFVLIDVGAVNDPAGQRVAATVGSAQITNADFQRQYRQLENTYRQMFGEQWNEEMASQFNLRKQAVDQLIDRRVLQLEAERIGLRASDAEVSRAFLEYPPFQDENGNFIGRERVSELLRLNRLREDEFVEQLREDLTLQKLQSVLADTIYVSDSELEEVYRSENEKAKIRYFQLPAANFAGQVSATNEQAKAYFDANAADYEVPEKRAVDYVLVDAVAMRREIEIPEDEMRQYWDDNAEEFEREEQVRARHILLRVTPDRDDAATRAEIASIKTRIEAGEDLGAIASEVSDDEGTAKRGGSLGFFGRGAMVPAFDQAAFAAEVGELVGPVKTDFGYHLIEVEEKREGGVQPFEEAQPVIRSRMLGERVDQLAEDKIKELAEMIERDGLTTSEQLAALAETEGVTFQEAPAFAANDAVTGIGRSAVFNEAVFALKEGELTEPIKVPRGWILGRVTSVEPPRLPTLAEVENEVRLEVEKELQREAAVAKLTEGRAAGTDFDTLATELEMEIRDSNEFGRYDSIGELGRNQEVVLAALGMEAGEISEPVITDQGAVLFEVVERTTFDAEKFATDKASTLETEKQQRLQQLLASVIEERKRDLAPKYDASLVEEFGLQANT